MKAFLVGLLVLMMMVILSGVGIMLIPLLLVLGVFLRIIISIFILLLAVWLIGKVTLYLIELLRNKETKKA